MCFSNRPLFPSSIYIKAGTFAEVREMKHVRAIHVHPKFNASTIENDIALIQVHRRREFLFTIWLIAAFTL